MPVTVIALSVACVLPSVPSEPWAAQVISYTPGSGVAPGYSTPERALGAPTRFTGVGAGFPGAVTPFNPPFEPTELVSIGTGGSLVVRFDHPVTDNPLNPFGIDLLVFGNTGLIDTAWPSGIAGGHFGAGGGTVEVSADGADWRLVPGVAADGLFPTLGYLDLPGPYAATPGAILSDFTRPVNPSLNLVGLTFAQIVDAYDGAGGGAGIDLASVGLASISYVRIRNLLPDVAVDIDAFAAVTPVPAPGACALLAFASVIASRRRP